MKANIYYHEGKRLSPDFFSSEFSYGRGKHATTTDRDGMVWKQSHFSRCDSEGIHTDVFPTGQSISEWSNNWH